MPEQIRQAEKTDLIALQHFINSQSFLHRHLDWRDTLEWLGSQPFYVLEENRKMMAVLACPPEPPTVAWLRLFGASVNMSADRAWKLLIEPSLDVLRTRTPRPILVSLSLRDWYEALLLRNGFYFHQDIVVFVYDEQPPAPPQLQTDITIREMTPADLPQVTTLDNLSFEPIWQLSPDDLSHALIRSSIQRLPSWMEKLSPIR